MININTINFGFKNGYFKSDIEIFQNQLDIYKNLAVFLFILLSFLFLFFRYKNKIQTKDSNKISPEFLKYTPLILFFSVFIYVNFDKLVTNCSLIINKQKQISFKERDFKIYSYDEKKEELTLIIEKEVELGLITEDFEFYKIKKDLYKSLNNNKNIKLKFKIGLLNIPFDPEYKKKIPKYKL